MKHFVKYSSMSIISRLIFVPKLNFMCNTFFFNNSNKRIKYYYITYKISSNNIGNE